jgi:hypothetical protein
MLNVFENYCIILETKYAPFYIFHAMEGINNNICIRYMEGLTTTCNIMDNKGILKFAFQYIPRHIIRYSDDVFEAGRRFSLSSFTNLYSG